MEQAPEEWTLEEARKHWRPMVRPVQHVGLPGYQFQAGVLWDGSPVFGPLDFRQLGVMQQELAPLGNHLLHLSIGYGSPMRFVDRRGTRNPAMRRWLEEGRLPIPHVETKDGDLVWHETVFAHLLGRKPQDAMTPQPDDVLVVNVRLQARNTGSRPATAHLWLHFGDTSQVKFGYKAHVADDLGKALPHRLGHSVAVSAELALEVEPAEIRMRLRSGDGRPLHSATINSNETPILDRDTLRLPQTPKGSYRIIGRFR